MASTGGIVSTPRVVGMCGLPAHAAAGIRAPVVEDPEGVFWPGDPEPEVAPPTEHDVAYMKRMYEEGFALQTEASWPWMRGGVVLYADPDYVCPGSRFFDLKAHLGSLVEDPSARVHIAYMHERDAHAQMAVWTQALLQDAEKALRRRDPERTFDSAMRARFATLDPAAERERKRMFIVLGVALSLMGDGTAGVLADASMDFDEASVDEIRTAISVRHLLLRDPPIRPTRFPAQIAYEPPQAA